MYSVSEIYWRYIQKLVQCIIKYIDAHYIHVEQICLIEIGSGRDFGWCYSPTLSEDVKIVPDP